MGQEWRAVHCNQYIISPCIHGEQSVDRPWVSMVINWVLWNFSAFVVQENDH